MRRAFLVLLATLSSLLSACQLESDQPLLGQQWDKLLNEEFVVAIEDKRGSLIDKDGKAQLLHLKFKDGWYEAVDDKNSSGLRVSFHKKFNGPFDYLLQVTQGSKTIYMAALRSGGYLHLQNISISANLASKLEAGGVKLATREMNRVVASKEDLMKVVNAWTEQNYLDLLDRSKYLIKFRLSVRYEDDTFKANILNLVQRDLCLAAAGHPMDPEVRKLPGAFSRGVVMGQIDVKTAVEKCSFAVATDAPLSAQYAMARILYQNKNYIEGVQIADRLMRKEFPLAYVLLADDLTAGLSRKADSVKARHLLDMNAHRDPVISYAAGLMHLRSAMALSDSEDEEDWEEEDDEYSEAKRRLEQAAMDGLPEAFTALGSAYAQGQSQFPVDQARAARLYERAGELGDTNGSLAAARAYYFGTGVEVDYPKAFKLVMPAAETGIAEAQYICGFMLAYGQGTTKSEAEAVTWLKAATAANYPSAKAELGRLTFLGLGVEADPASGRKMLEEAAQAGDTRAAEYLVKLGITAPVAQTDP